MENQRKPDEENRFERDMHHDLSATPITGAERSNMSNDLDDDDEDRWDDELELNEDLDEE